MTEQITNEDPARVAHARSAIYGLLAACLSEPNQALLNDLALGPSAPLMQSLLRGFEVGTLDSLLAPGRQQDTHQLLDSLKSEHLRVFVGPGHVPVPPYESVHRKDVSGLEMGLVMGSPTVDAVRKYAQAGLALARSFGDLPDHVAVELEFMSYLCAQEAEARQRGHDHSHFVKAQRAFLSEHLVKWLPFFCAKIQDATGVQFYRDLARLADRFVAGEAANSSAHQNLLATLPKPVDAGTHILHALEPGSSPAPTSERGVFHTVCPGSGDHQRCGVKCFVQDGRIVRIEADDFPDPRYHKAACLRPLSSMRWVYSPDRLKFPMKRVGERGAGQWERISWEEAYDTIAARLDEIRRTYGERAVHLRGGSSSTNGQLMKAIATRFSALWGPSVSWQRGVIDSNLPAACSLVTGASYHHVAHSALDWRNAKMIVIWGENPAETDMRDMTHLLDARDNGTRLALISPFFDPTAAKVHEFIPVFPATDAALALSFIHVIIERGLYDADFVRNYTNLPFLVRSDTRRFLRESDIAADGDPTSYVVWDANTDSAKAVAPGVNEIEGVSPVLLGAFRLGNLECKPAFQLLEERAAHYPPHEVASLCRVPAEQIESFAVEYATLKPVYTKMSHGSARTYQGTGIVRSQFYLSALTGNIGIPGGGIGYEAYEYQAALNTRAVTAARPHSNEVRYADTYSQFWTHVAEGTGPWPIKAAIQVNASWVNYCGNSREWIERIFPQLDFIVVSDIFLTYTAQYADILLPGQTQYERQDIDVGPGVIRLCEKPIEPLYECRDNFELWPELARRLGYGEYFDHTPEEYLEMMLDSAHPTVAGITPKLTLERLKEVKSVRPNVPEEPYIPFRDRTFDTPSGRMELYDERLIPFGEELPDFKEGFESPRTSPLAQKYPLVYYTKKTRFNSQTQFRNVDWLLEIASEPFLEINPADASPRGIADGDLIKVFNDRGYCVVKAMLHDGMPPGVVNIPHGWFPNQFVEGYHTDLLAPVTPPEKVDNPVALVATAIDTAAGPGELLYDCLVQVARVAEGSR